MNRIAAPIVVLALIAGLPCALAQGDPRAAESQYRVARRLAAEGSAQAGAALRRVVELDPSGPLADDALLDLADLEGLPLWPEEIGAISSVSAERALRVLRELLDNHAGGDRVTEARLRESLLLLEPLPFRDPGRARVELLAIATGDLGEPSGRARYIMGWLDERRGQGRQARAAYQRLVVDDAGDAGGVRALVGLGRVLMREGEFGSAAAWLQEAVESNAPPGTGAAALRELAVRALLREAGRGTGWQGARGTRASSGLRSLHAFARLPAGGWLVAERRGDEVIRLGVDGLPAARWALPEVQAIAVDPYGRAFVAAGDGIFRLEEDRAVAVATQGSISPVSALAVDGGGGWWVADRRGERVARIAPAGEALEQTWDLRSLRISSLVWDGLRIVVADLREGRLLSLAPDGTTAAFSDLAFQKPVALAADPAGQIGVLDTKAQEVVLVGPDGSPRDRLSIPSIGATRPAGLALGENGSLDLLDAAGGAVVSIP